MKHAFSKLSLTPLIVVVFASFAVIPVDEAAGQRGGRGGSGGGAKPNAQANNTKVDARTNNVRSTSVNNVNVNKNVNVNVDNNRGGCCNNGWDNDNHPIATAVAVTATVAIVGSMVRTVPAGCVPVNYGGIVYQQCGTTWYQPQGTQFVVINAPY